MAIENKILPEWFGADKSVALYTQVQTMVWRNNVNVPIRTFWTDREIVINPKWTYFFSPALRKFSKWQVEGSFVAWLDFDDIEVLPKFHLFPSLIISSGSGYHVYWKFDEFIFIDTLNLYLERLVKYYGSDPMARDVTRFMRLPGSLNMKYSPPRVTQIISFSDKVYSANQIMALPDKKQAS
jgi:hypothetical protein